MRSEVRRIKLVDIAAPIPNAVAAGPFGSNLVSRDYVESGVPVIRGQNLYGRWVAGEFVFVTSAKAEQLRSNTAKPGDIVFTQRGTLGQVSVVPAAPFGSYVVSQSQMKLTVERSAADPRYVYYACSAPDFVAQVHNNAIATGVPHINLGILRRLEIPLPSMQTQVMAADVLAALDDRIDLLRQTNATLESMAKALFKSWFIDFDPVRAKTEGLEPEGMDAATAALFPAEFDESVLGLIPKGWQAGKLDAICINPRAQAKPGQMSADTTYIGLEHMPRKSIALDSAGTAAGLESGKFWFERNDVLFGKLRPYFHKVGLAPCRGVCSTDILVLRPKAAEWLGFLAMHASSDALVSHATQLSNGARMPRTSWHDVGKFDVALPSQCVAAGFNVMVYPLFQRIHTNIEAARVLSELRNSLLPRLISGKLRLPEARAQLEEAIA